LPLAYYYNANVITMNPSSPTAPHMLVCGDRVLHCDNSRAPFGLDYRDADFGRVRQSMAGQVRFVDLGGRTVIPGICDAHAHFLMWGEKLTHVDLSGGRSEEDCVRLLKEGAADVAKGEWVRGRNWSNNLWDNTAFPSRDSLDAAFPDNPVLLTSKCCHVIWVNSAALAAAGVDDHTPDPHGGEIERRGGRLTGILKEDANELVSRAVGEMNIEQWYAAMDRAQSVAHGLGITAMQTPEYMDMWTFLQGAHAEERLTMRINFWMPISVLDELVGAGIRHGLGDDRLRISAVKVFMDGSLGGRTALMYDPYEGEPDNFGIEVTDAETIARWTLQANRAGLSMAVHAIGDLAVGNVISAYEASAAELGTGGDTRTNPVLRNRIEHLQVFSDRDLDRLKRLRPVVSIQPIHLCADMGPADRHWGARSKNAYACRTVKDLGSLMVFGSDVPVESCNPFYGLYAATTRKNMDAQPASGWYPEQCISLQEALEAYTINCATASGQQDVLGSLEAGKLADFVVLTENPFEVGPEDLRDMKPLATVSGGTTVFEAAELEGLL
jgi:predicted amidohydrolase YtcJ